MSRTEALPTIPISVPHKESCFSATAIMLIQVPRVTPTSRYPLRLTPPCPARPRSRTAHRPRRRLRKNVRLAAVALVALLPLPLGLAVAGWPTVPRTWRQASSRVLAIPAPVDSAALGSFHVPVWLSVESAGPAVHDDTETPVVLPGYLLPDDNHEESAHAGS